MNDELSDSALPKPDDAFKARLRATVLEAYEATEPVSERRAWRWQWLVPAAGFAVLLVLFGSGAVGTGQGDQQAEAAELIALGQDLAELNEMLEDDMAALDSLQSESL